MTTQTNGWGDAPEQDRVRYKFTITEAVRTMIWMKLGLCGAGGSGKTYTAIRLACALAALLGLPMPYVIDSERGSALRYAKSPKRGTGFSFNHCALPEHDNSPEAYTAAIEACLSAGAKVIVIDSISHAWDGERGCLEHVDEITGGDDRKKFQAWAVVTPQYRRLLGSIMGADAHMIFTVRAKIAYEARKNDRGKTEFHKIGLGPIARDGIEYEPDMFAWMADAILTMDKTRCDTIESGSVWEKPGDDFAARLSEWILDAEPAPQRDATPPPPPRPAWAQTIFAATKTGTKAMVEAAVNVPGEIPAAEVEGALLAAAVKVKESTREMMLADLRARRQADAARPGAAS